MRPLLEISDEDGTESLEETLAVLSNSNAVAELVEAHHSYLEGDVVRGLEAVRDLRPGDVYRCH